MAHVTCSFASSVLSKVKSITATITKNSAFQKYKDEITPSLEPVERKIATIERKLDDFAVRCGEISDQQAATESEIHTTFRRMQLLLACRKTELIRRTQLKSKELDQERDQVETILAQLRSFFTMQKRVLSQAMRVMC